MDKVSIITPCYTVKRLKDIFELLDSIEGQTYKDIEAIIIAERSREMADAITQYATEKGISNVRVLYNEEQWGSYSSRNLGIKHAGGNIIAFIDDDAILFPDWAEETIKAYAEDDSIIGLTGPILPLWARPDMSWFPRELYWIFSCTYWDWTSITEVRNGYGTNVSFLRDAFECCGLFRESLEDNEVAGSDWQRPGAKETEFSLRVTRQTGRRIVYHPNIKVKHKVYRYRLSTSFLIKRAYWEGYAKALLNKRYRSSQDNILSTEYSLLGRIFFHALPFTLFLIIRRPMDSFRRLWVFSLTLSFVSIGYASSWLRNLLRGGKSFA